MWILDGWASVYLPDSCSTNSCICYPSIFADLCSMNMHIYTAWLSHWSVHAMTCFPPFPWVSYAYYHVDFAQSFFVMTLWTCCHILSTFLMVLWICCQCLPCFSFSSCLPAYVYLLFYVYSSPYVIPLLGLFISRYGPTCDLVHGT